MPAAHSRHDFDRLQSGTRDNRAQSGIGAYEWPQSRIWNRLEPRSRVDGLAGGLAARVHDPLWLLARQWQVGEFAGKDAGSPLTAQVKWTTADLRPVRLRQRHAAIL